MLLGSPTQGPMSPNNGGAYMADSAYMADGGYMASAPAAVMSPGGPMLSQYEYDMLASMQQAATAAMMMQHAGDVAAYDAVWASALGSDMPVPLPAAYSTPPPRRAAPGGYGGQRSGGYRGTPAGGARMSRFAPPDAVAAF